MKRGGIDGGGTGSVVVDRRLVDVFGLSRGLEVRTRKRQVNGVSTVPLETFTFSLVQ